MKKVVLNALAVATVSVVKKIKFNIQDPSILGGFFIANILLVDDEVIPQAKL